MLIINKDDLNMSLFNVPRELQIEKLMLNKNWLYWATTIKLARKVEKI